MACFWKAGCGWTRGGGDLKCGAFCTGWPILLAKPRDKARETSQKSGTTAEGKVCVCVCEKVSNEMQADEHPKIAFSAK